MQNIMIDLVHSLAKIIDFGLSNNCSELLTPCGSPEYAAPEIFQPNSSYGAQVDVWSLGVIMFGMCAGVLPFLSTNNSLTSVASGDSRKKLIREINKGITNKQLNLLNHYSKDFGNLLREMLHPDPKTRVTLDKIMSHKWVSVGRTDWNSYIHPTNHTKTYDKVFEEVAFLLQLPVVLLVEKLTKNPHGEVGAIYQIIIHKELEKYWCRCSLFSQAGRRIFTSVRFTSTEDTKRRLKKTKRNQSVTFGCESHRSHNNFNNRPNSLECKRSQIPYSPTELLTNDSNLDDMCYHYKYLQVMNLFNKTPGSGARTRTPRTRSRPKQTLSSRSSTSTKC